ncbi:unnamed protein product [Clonostachys rosea f. rosea IK726]|uniref:Uncharacterized protein n=1 Tax=Clonostachys rosea f. rosea IK726 TaxID=1349383 RepID=A0ACA9TFV3_BIOOC|nr:unnamed protein product [Clonostachys rosea f. rosea IK726]
MSASPPIQTESIPLEDQATAAAGSTDTLNGRPPSPPTQEQAPSIQWRGLRRKLRPLRGVIFAWVAFSVFSVIFSAFVVYVLLRGNVRVGGVTFDASTSNLLVSIFSQISVILGDALIRDLLGVIRLALAKRDRGVSALTYFVIGPASAWTEAARHAVLTKFYRLNLWCDFSSDYEEVRGKEIPSHSMPVQAQFDYHFAPTNTNMTVYAGLIPIRIVVVDSPLLTTADLSMYFYSLTSSLLLDSRYAIQHRFPGCSQEGCRSILLPGGLETARQYNPLLKHTVFEGGIFDGADSIQIEHAPGMLATFERLPADFSFDPAGCTYAGERINNTLVMCAQQLGQSLAVGVKEHPHGRLNNFDVPGWAACPIKEYSARDCSPEVTWTSGPIQYSTNVSVYEQYTRTTYNRNNFSIVNTELTSPVGESQITLKEDEYRRIFRKVLNANTTRRSDLSNMDALVHSITWLHRTYDNSFPDDQQSVLTSLHNFIGVSLQFMVTAVQFANYTVNVGGGTDTTLALPDSMVTSAVSGRSMQKLSIQHWTGVIFIVTEGLIIVFTALAILLILWGVERLPDKSATAEIDILRNTNDMRAAPQRHIRRWGWWPFRRAGNEVELEVPQLEERERFLDMAQTLAQDEPSLTQPRSLWGRLRRVLRHAMDKERDLLQWVVFLHSTPDIETEEVEVEDSHGTLEDDVAPTSSS